MTPDLEPHTDPQSRWRRWMSVLGGIIVGILLVGLMIPFFLKSNTGDGSRSEAVSNGKQVGEGLLRFQDRFGRFPDAETIPLVMPTAKDRRMRLGTRTSNDFLRQLFASGIVDSERPFFTKTGFTRRPDDRTGGSMLLEKGEVGFGYMISHSACVHDDVPMLLTPLVPGKLLFDPERWDRKVVMVYRDGRASIDTVRKDGRVVLNGKDFFDPSQPYWHGIPPKVAWPE